MLQLLTLGAWDKNETDLRARILHPMLGASSVTWGQFILLRVTRGKLSSTHHEVPLYWVFPNQHFLASLGGAKLVCSYLQASQRQTIFQPLLFQILKTRLSVQRESSLPYLGTELLSDKGNLEQPGARISWASNYTQNACHSIPEPAKKIHLSYINLHAASLTAARDKLANNSWNCED